MNIDNQLGHSHTHNYLLMERLLTRLVKKWAAGQDMEDALIAAKSCNMKGQKAILNYLGEDNTEEERINRTTKEYSDLLERLHADQIDGCISVKPSQLGLCISYELCLKKLKAIINGAMKFRVFVWIDMESSKYTDDTLMLYLELFAHYPEIGVVLQSALRRSASDLLHLMEVGAKVRLVKGAYHENEQIAFVHHEEINANYIKLLEMLFSRNYMNNNEVDNALKFAVATHDSKLIEYAIKLSKTAKIGIKNFEFEFLKGIRDELKSELVEEGFRVAEYIPYGDEWLPYSVRRLSERKRNLFLLARSLVQS
ncbi:MAG: proline dehydrogenase family protein [Nitrososphaeraceae archaeon]|jgi:proline dehydrogenase